MTNRSAEWTGRGFEVHDLPIPDLQPGEVCVRIAACGICMTEVHFVEGYYDAFKLPSRLGHEFGGIVEAVGPGVDCLPVGSTVGSVGAFGGFANVAVASAEAFHLIRGEVLPHHAAFLEPVSACIAAVRRGRIPTGGTVLVTGAGSNGLLIIQLARRCGAARTIVSEPDESRRRLARELGADVAFDPIVTPAPEALSSEHVDVAFETSGNPLALHDCLDVIANGGRVVMFGVSRDTARIELPLFPFHLRNAELIASMGFDPESTSAAAGFLQSLELERLISHRMDLENIGAAFEAARSGAGLKVLVYPRAT